MKNPHPLQDLINNNHQWAKDTITREPGFFTRLVNQQSPQYLWVGCADSRVPANEIVGLRSGELFVHRNVANVVVHSDLNCLSVVQFAVDRLKVKHIMVVGHYGCSGVMAAMNNIRVGLADNWLRHVQDVRIKHALWLDRIEDETQRHNALVELNAIEQAVNVCNTTVIQDAWDRGQDIVIHGWVYALHNGLLQDLRMAISRPDEVQSVFEQALHRVHERYSEYVTVPAPL